MIFPNKKYSCDVKQILVFGMGYGESILVNIGNDNYILIDSFINPETHNPVAADYLRNIGLNEDSIVGIICTHWDDDHTKGIATLIEKMSRVIDVYVPLVQAGRELQKLARYLQNNSNPDELNSTSEFVKLQQLKKQNKVHIRYAHTNTQLFPTIFSSFGEDASSLIALSPSEERIGEFIEALVDPRVDDPIHNIPVSNNNVSIVTLLSKIVDSTLFGGDLENNDGDWDSVVENYPNTSKCHVFKIPHHGSSGSFCQNVWNKVVERPISIITRFNRSNLPEKDEVCHLRALSSEVYIVGGKKEQDKNLSSKLKGTMGDMLDKITVIDRKIGVLSLSWLNNSWIVETYGEVVKIDDNAHIV